MDFGTLQNRPTSPTEPAQSHGNPSRMHTHAAHNNSPMIDLLQPPMAGSPSAGPPIGPASPSRPNHGSHHGLNGSVESLNKRHRASLAHAAVHGSWPDQGVEPPSSLLSKDLEYTKAYVRCDSGYDGYHETHLIVAVYSEHVPSHWAVKMRIRPPEFETSICDAKYHVSLHSWPPPLSSLSKSHRRRLHAPPPPPPLLRRKIVSGQFDEENPSVQISSGLLVQADEGVSNPVVDLIGVNYRNLP
ncbi:hypothetical protein F511_23118 [Dorcoceras hygrometricum]|uniref:Uncharacterized protein n=1 Tax=Dorcoceras hygrometricum TaxID=472368 RepID=A0A2Z7AJF1_9LAMI|nr:hypothetical protein F511_23118 [Dorcoceras hygrometricum]